MEYNLKHRDDLLSDIATGLGEGSADSRLSNIYVVFHCGADSYRFSLESALDQIANDLYWDDRGNWSEATTATVETI
jgi:hypothetical protein